MLVRAVAAEALALSQNGRQRVQAAQQQQQQFVAEQLQVKRAHPLAQIAALLDSDLSLCFHAIKLCMQQLPDCLNLQLQQLTRRLALPVVAPVFAPVAPTSGSTGSSSSQQQYQQLAYALQHFEAGLRVLHSVSHRVTSGVFQNWHVLKCQELVLAVRAQLAATSSSAAVIGTLTGSVHGQLLLQALLSLSATDAKLESMHSLSASFLPQGAMACMGMLLAHASATAAAGYVTVPPAPATQEVEDDPSQQQAGADGMAAEAMAVAAGGSSSSSLHHVLTVSPTLVAATTLMGHVLFLSGHIAPLGPQADDVERISWALLTTDLQHIITTPGRVTQLLPHSVPASKQQLLSKAAAIPALGQPLQAIAEQLGCTVGMQQLSTLQGQVQLTGQLLRRLLGRLEPCGVNAGRSGAGSEDGGSSSIDAGGTCSSSGGGGGEDRSSQHTHVDSSPPQSPLTLTSRVLASGLAAALAELEGNLLPMVASVQLAIQQHCGAEAAHASSTLDTATAADVTRRKSRKHQQANKAAKQQSRGSSAGKLLLPQLPALAASLKAAGAMLCSALPCSFFWQQPCMCQRQWLE